MNSSTAGCSAAAEDFFNPIGAVQGCGDGFDFTLTFEQYIFSLVPASTLLFLAPFRILHLRRLPIIVCETFARHIKLLAISTLSLSQLTSLILWAAQFKDPFNTLRTASLVASCVSFMASLLACVLSHYEHARSMRPSALYTTYLFISVTLDAATLRTIWIRPSIRSSIRAVATVSLALKAVVLVLEAREKRALLISNPDRKLQQRQQQQEYGPEETSGIFSQSFFWWLNELLLRGFSQLLRPDDLYPTQHGMSAAVLNKKFWDKWNQAESHTRDGDQQQQQQQHHKYRLIWTCIKALKWPILAAVPPRLVLVALTICQPLLLNRFLFHLQGLDGSRNIGYGLIAAYGLVYLGMAISSSFYYHRAFRTAAMLRGLLIAAVFQKTTEISSAATDGSASLTLMSTDVDTIVGAVRQAHDLWAGVIQVSIATWLLSTFIGPAAAAPVVVCLASLGLTIYVSPQARKSQGAWLDKVQKRVGVTSRMLGHMKSIKMSGLARRLAATIAQMRTDEIQAARPFRMIMVSTAALAQVPVLLAPVAAFAAFVLVAARTGQTFDATRLFSSLSLIILLAAPLFGTFEIVLNLQSSMACFDRIQKYLLAESRKDRRERPVSSEESRRERFCPGSLTGFGSANDEEEQYRLAQIQSPEIGLHKDQSCTTGIQLQKASFGWSPGGQLVVNKVSMTVARGQFLILAGPVASGKSTLLKGILGEAPISKGDVSVVQARTSWCEQTPWIKNESVRQNIIGYNHFNSDLYRQVVHACDLHKDFSQFPYGDETLVGSKGISLSGGQKQRVALARSVYSRPRIAIFDDVLSGLDNHTTRLVCTRLFDQNEGVLRKWGTTIVLVTQSVSCIPMADRIVVLSRDGTIEEEGSFEELVNMGGYIGSVFESRNREANDNGDDTNTVQSEIDSAAVKESSKEPKKPSDSTDKRRQHGDSTVYLFYFSSLGSVFVATLLVVELASAFLQVFPTVWLKWWSDASAVDGSRSLGFYLGIYSALQIAAVGAFFTLTWFVIVKVVAKSGFELHNRLLRAVVRAPLSLFTSDDTGSLTTRYFLPWRPSRYLVGVIDVDRFSQDIGEVDRNLPLGMLVTIQNFLTCIGQAVLIASASWYMAISYPFLIGVFYTLQKAYLRTSRQLRFLDLEEKAPVYTQFIETLAGLPTIRAFGWEQAALEQNHYRVDRAQSPFYLLMMVQRWLTLVLDLIVAALALLVVGLAVRLRDSDGGGVSVGLTGVSLVQLITFAETVRMLVLWWTSLETSIGAVARIKRFSEEAGDENRPGENELPPPVEWPVRGQVEIRDLSVSYDEDGKNIVLRNVSVSIEAGQKVAIVERTGSGKSSLLLSLVQMLHVSSGSITIDGLDVSTVPREDVRSGLITIAQDQFFLPGTWRQNIDPHGTANSDQITEVLSKVGLLEVVGRDDQNGGRGFDSDFEEDKLSQGQRQLFFLARAVLRGKGHGRVVLMDEATSSIDQHTERRVQELIREEFQAHTVIAIAHRLESILGFDRVVVLEGGCVVEYGEPADLLHRPGPFKALWEAAHSHRASA